ncbi:ras association domain-containing protein 5 [Aquarana catesbeiana]|uniref:ras association domain-containing protein 5 n=1 Tax=Aquarana catesbeiana TaxID=8400 RepID=UPI003CCA5ED7
MMVSGSMSSGYSSLEEDIEDYFFTAKENLSRRSAKVQYVQSEEKKPDIQELTQKIEIFNNEVQNGLVMKMAEDGTYTGFVKVHLQLRRPVTVSSQTPSVYTKKETSLDKAKENWTSLNVPLDAMKQLHISSITTVSEVIRGLLQKFQVVDDPLKFALFKKMQKDGQVFFQKLALTEHPLYVRLLAGPDADVLSFVLKENEIGDVQWDAFTVPELQNFLLILEKEEREKVQHVQKKFVAFRQHLQEALKDTKKN